MADPQLSYGKWTLLWIPGDRDKKRGIVVVDM